MIKDDDAFTRAFARSLSAALDARGLSRAWLARESGVREGAVSSYVRGECSPSLSRAVAIANALGMSLDEMAAVRDDEAAAGTGPVHTPLRDARLDEISGCYLKMDAEGRAELAELAVFLLKRHRASGKAS